MKAVRWLAILMVLGLLGAACQSSTSSSATSPASTAAGGASATSPAGTTYEASMVFNWFAQPEHGGFYAATKEGIYEKVGIKMTLQQGGPEISSVPLVLSGKHTFGMAQADQLLHAREEGQPVVAIFGTFQDNPQGFMYHDGNNINDFSDLKGKTLIISTPADYFDYIKGRYNLTDIKQVNYNGQLTNWLADKTAVTQCYVTEEPYYAKLQGANPKTLAISKSGYNPYANVIFTTEQTIKDKPDLVKKFVQASREGWEKYFASPKTTNDFMKTFNKDLDDAAMGFALEQSKPLVTGGDAQSGGIGAMTDARWKTLHDQMVEAKSLKAPLDYKKVYTLQFLSK